jgi:hypothetical protein
MVWVMQNLWEHLVDEGAEPPTPGIKNAADRLTNDPRRSAHLAVVLRDEWWKLLQQHIYWQFLASGLLVGGGLLWVISEVA